MKSHEIRQKFLDYFRQHGHEIVASSSLIPAQDPTILFANAGMNQFKDLFLGKEKRSYTRAASVQKCVRAGGKHNDLDNVGFTKRHLTFFEMMGNFSFGDYFKKEAIPFAWDLLVNHLGFDPKLMHVTVFRTDDEAYDIWHKDVGVAADHITRLGEKDNFWQMGDTGPCGPCTEIYVDRGLQHGCGKENCAPGCDCDRFLEVWNLVFMQFDRQPSGELVPLKQTGVDTGMGFERLLCIMQGKDSVYETDAFSGIIAEVERLTGVSYAEQTGDRKAAFQVLGDHIRSTSLIIADGGSPSNEGRGYVLRKIIRRAALFAQKLTDKNIFPDLARYFIKEMGPIYPELKQQEQIIIAVLTSEIEKFATNLVRGKNLLQECFAQQAGDKKITGAQAFKLYDTYGFPIELTRIIAHENGFTVDEAGFEVEMEKQRAQSGKKVAPAVAVTLPDTIASEFTGYQELERTSKVLAILQGDQAVSRVDADQECWVILAHAPFYVEKGGQVDDRGWIAFPDGGRAPISGLKNIGNAIAIKIVAPQSVAVGDEVTSIVDAKFRTDTMKNHTATHLLQAALIQLFGKQIKQSGSLVTADYLRFDFTYHQNLTLEDIKKVEDLVNAKIMENIPTCIEQSTLAQATKDGVIAFFGDKYNPEKVRVIKLADFSAELCGGTHVRATGDIGCFKITEVTALSAGNRRLVAVTGPKAVALLQETFGTIKQLCQEFKIQADDVLDAVAKQRDQLRQAQTAVKALKKELLATQIPAFLAQAQDVSGITMLVAELPGCSTEELRETADRLQDKRPGLYMLLSTNDGRSSFVVSCAQAHAPKVDMPAFAQWLQQTFGLRGGGKGTSLQGGGAAVNVADVRRGVSEWLARK